MEETGKLIAEEGNDRMLSVNANRKCSIGIYPFFDGKLEDFEPVFAELIKVCPFHLRLLIFAKLFMKVQPKTTLRLRRLRRPLLARGLSPRRTSPSGRKIERPPSRIIFLSASGRSVPYRSLPHPTLTKAEGGMDSQQSRIRERRGAPCWQIQRCSDTAYAPSRRGGCHHTSLYATPSACLIHKSCPMCHSDLRFGRI